MVLATRTLDEAEQRALDAAAGGRVTFAAPSAGMPNATPSVLSDETGRPAVAVQVHVDAHRPGLLRALALTSLLPLVGGAAASALLALILARRRAALLRLNADLS